MNRSTPTRLRTRLALALCALVGMNAAAVASASPRPVLLVIANQDFYLQEYAAVRASLEAQGLRVVVAAGQRSAARPQGATFGTMVQPDRALSATNASDYSAIAFVGGWGASQYQYSFEGTYANTAYNGSRYTRQAVNDLIGDFVAQGKPVAALDHGVTVLAWARVDGISPISGRVVVGPVGGTPAYRLQRDFGDGETAMRGQIEANGAFMPTASSLGDPLTGTDDVIIDGQIITGQELGSAARFAEAIAQAVAGNSGN